VKDAGEGPGARSASPRAQVALRQELDSHPESRVRNSQAHGIGRVAELGDLVAWNNLGRNIVFADRAFRPLSIYDETAFPAQDEPSQYDLDVHAILRPAGSDWVLALNHLGTLRVFRASELRAPGTDRRARPVAEMHFVEDAERVVAAGGRLLASRPRSDGAGGLLVSAPVGPELRGGLPVDAALESWQRVTALDASTSASGEAWIAIGAGRRVGIAPLTNGRVGRSRWEVNIPWRCAWLRWQAPLLWVAGSEPNAPGVGDHDWDRLRGGGLLAFRLEDGQRMLQRPFECDLAWGNGGVALCAHNGAICALDRSGALHAFRARDGRFLGSSAPLSTGSLGIAHAAGVGAAVLAGFNRAGYRLFVYSISRGV
jgi:hypothetical protein